MSRFYKHDPPFHLYGHQDTKIATGAYGAVYRTTYSFAIKYFEEGVDIDGEAVFLIREIAAMRALQHPNILELLAVYCEEYTRTVYMPLALFTLDDILCNLSSADRLLYMHQLVQAVKHCHDVGFIHRDIKPDNVLIFSEKQLKLADFSLAKMDHGGAVTHTNNVATLWWRAPEIILGTRNYSFEIDVWSVGVIFLTALLKYNPLQSRSEDMQMTLICKLLGTPTPDDCPELTDYTGIGAYTKKELSSLKIDSDLAFKMVAWRPYRITITQAAKHEYFTGAPILKSAPPSRPSRVTTTAFDLEKRMVLFEWLWMERSYCKLHYNTLLLAYSIFDRFICKKPIILSTDIQGYGICSLLLAAKLYEEEQPAYSHYIKLYSSTRLRMLESDILRLLDYDIFSDFYHMSNKRFLQDSRRMDLFVALHLNYVWAREWSSKKFRRTVKYYLNGTLKPGLKAAIDAHLASIEGALGDAVK